MHKQVSPKLGQKQCLSFLETITTGSPQVVKPSWHHISSSGNQTSTSLINTILYIGCSNTCSPPLPQELAIECFEQNSCHLHLLHSLLPLATNYDWSLSSTAQSHLSGNFCICCSVLGGSEFAMCWIHLHLLLLNSSAFTILPGGGNTTLDFIVRILLGHKGYLLWTSPKVSTVSNL